VPTTHPRYTVTDTGELREMLDLAQRRWPELRDRRRALLALAGAGRDAIAADLDEQAREQRRRRQREALGRAADLVDADGVLADAPWR
jgi:post-segregation antitoxin (ccd killing protein)